MCSGGGGGSAPAKVDPTPVQVTSAETGADQAEAMAKNKRGSVSRPTCLMTVAPCWAAAAILAVAAFRALLAI